MLIIVANVQLLYTVLVMTGLMLCSWAVHELQLALWR